jgi:hypothetical protein
MMVAFLSGIMILHPADHEGGLRFHSAWCKGVASAKGGCSDRLLPWLRSCLMDLWRPVQ